jgi:hypothetical protein
MKRIVAVVVGAILACTMVMAQDASKAEAKKAPEVKAQTTCPVLEGQKIDKSLYVDFEGKRIYVCCKGCLADVTKEPAKYVKKLEDAGITLDKVPAAAPTAPAAPAAPAAPVAPATK